MYWSRVKGKNYKELSEIKGMNYMELSKVKKKKN